MSGTAGLDCRPFLLPGKIPGCMTTGAPMAAATSKQSTITCTLAFADGLEHAGDVHAVEGGMNGEVLGVTVKQGGIGDKMQALVHHLDEIREGGKLIQRLPQAVYPSGSRLRSRPSRAVARDAINRYGNRPHALIAEVPGILRQASPHPGLLQAVSRIRSRRVCHHCRTGPNGERDSAMTSS